MREYDGRGPQSPASWNEPGRRGGIPAIIWRKFSPWRVSFSARQLNFKTHHAVRSKQWRRVPWEHQKAGATPATATNFIILIASREDSTWGSYPRRPGALPGLATNFLISNFKKSADPDGGL